MIGWTWCDIFQANIQFFNTSCMMMMKRLWYVCRKLHVYTNHNLWRCIFYVQIKWIRLVEASLLLSRFLFFTKLTYFWVLGVLFWFVCVRRQGMQWSETVWVAALTQPPLWTHPPTVTAFLEAAHLWVSVLTWWYKYRF